MVRQKIYILFYLAANSCAFVCGKRDGSASSGKTDFVEKVFDDPYSTIEKDEDVYDATEKFSDVTVLPKRNPYKIWKKNKGQFHGLSEEQQKMFEELATFNYGVIGVLKRRLDEGRMSEGEGAKRRESADKGAVDAEETAVAGQDDYSEEGADLDTAGWFD